MTDPISMAVLQRAAKVTACATCGGGVFTTVLDLGEQPLAERDDGNRYPLAVAECRHCGLAQLAWAVVRAQVFPASHPYTTGNSAALRRHFDGLAQQVAAHLKPGDLAVDIGANDGTLLAAVRRHAPHARILGVEPTGQAAKARAQVIPVEQAFWSAAEARRIRRLLGPATVITACNVLAHAGSQADFLAGVDELLADGGLFVTENHDWNAVVAGLQVDTVYHEHLRYYTPGTLAYALSRAGLQAVTTESVSTHGGSFRTWARRQPDSAALAGRAAVAAGDLRRLMEKCAGQGPVYGVSAATRATPLIWWSGIAAYIDRIAEIPGSDKIGTQLPGTGIYIVDEADLIANQPPYALLLAWHIAGDIVPKLRAAGYEGQFIVPLPVARLWHG